MAIPIRRDTPIQHPVIEHDVHHKPLLWPHAPNVALAALRIVAGLLFMQHGVQKMFGLLLPAAQQFNGAPAMFSQMWFAGVLEVFGGLLIVLGLFTRPVAFVLAGEMAVAYFKAHFPQGFWPALNGGELAALYSFIFLTFAAIGGGRFSVDEAIHHARRPKPVLHR
jgi:putative oxidoreductase